jgi:hypothetical protein
MANYGPAAGGMAATGDIGDTLRSIQHFRRTD